MYIKTHILSASDLNLTIACHWRIASWFYERSLVLTEAAVSSPQPLSAAHQAELRHDALRADGAVKVPPGALGGVGSLRHHEAVVRGVGLPHHGAHALPLPRPFAQLQLQPGRAAPELNLGQQEAAALESYGGFRYCLWRSLCSQVKMVSQANISSLKLWRKRGLSLVRSPELARMWRLQLTGRLGNTSAGTGRTLRSCEWWSLAPGTPYLPSWSVPVNCSVIANQPIMLGHSEIKDCPGPTTPGCPPHSENLSLR